MFRRTLLFAILIALVIGAVSLALFAANAPKDVFVRLPGFEVETSRLMLGIAVCLVGAAIAVIWWFLASLFNLPGQLAKSTRQSRLSKARNALSDGLIAAEGGDAERAARQAKRAASLTKIGSSDRKLALLLAARAAETNGDWIEAEKAYAELSREKGAELAGLRGLAAAAVKRGDHSGAKAHASAAFQLKSKADWPFGSLFELQTKAADWLGASDTLQDGVKRSAIDGATAARRRAVLLTAEAYRQRRNSPSESEQLALEAAKTSAGFPPAALLAGRLQLAAGRAGKAQNVIESAWRARPHPALSLLWSDLKPGESALAHAARIEKLVDQNPDHRESRILKGEASIAKGDWVKAAQILTPIIEEGATGRLCTLMEAVARGRGDGDEAARWARLAASAAREPDWSDIDPDGRAFDYSDEDWARMVYTYGDGGVLIHPRYEGYGRELETLSRLALPNAEPEARAAPAPTSHPETEKPKSVAPPTDYAKED